MTNREDLEGYISRLEDAAVTSREVEEDLWILGGGDESSAGVVVNYAPPVVVLRVNVMELPKKKSKRSELFQRLLELNATDLVHGSYGIEGDLIVLTDALQLENLDFNEFRASYDSINLALASHLPALAKYGEA